MQNIPQKEWGDILKAIDERNHFLLQYAANKYGIKVGCVFCGLADIDILIQVFQEGWREIEKSGQSG